MTREDRRLFPARIVAARRHRRSTSIPAAGRSTSCPSAAAHILPDKVQEAARRSRPSKRFRRALVDADAGDRCGRHVRHRRRGDGQAVRHHRTGRRRHLARANRAASRGAACCNVLRHAGIVAGAVETSPTQWLDMPSGDCFSFAEDDGMIETMVDLGEPVEARYGAGADPFRRPHRHCAPGDPGKDVGPAGGAAFPRLGARPATARPWWLWKFEQFRGGFLALHPSRSPLTRRKEAG